MDFILQWIDLIWLPIGVLAVHKPQRVITGCLFVGCMLMMRLQVELMNSTGFTTGFTPLMTSGVLARGLAVYSLFYAVFIGLAIYSPKTETPIFMAAAISIFFSALFVSMIVMII